MHMFRPVANGIRTDHPVPDIPFVDDAHLPLDDPRGIEAVGRGVGEGMWGRCDELPDGSWLAFTTDPIRQDLGWCVRFHPKYGRTVLVYRDDDASSVHMDWWGPPLLFRAGGYWWDGHTWYRPGQIFDTASEDYARRPVPAAVTVSAADLLDDSCDPKRGRVGKIANLDPNAPASTRWLDDLALWAKRRAERTAGLSLTTCVVKLSAPELAGDQLVGIAELAAIGGINPSTLRAYIARGEGEVPPPQATVSGRSVWARPVAEEWAEARRRSPQGVAALVAAAADEGAPSLPSGADEVRRDLSTMFMASLWARPDRRKRWALRYRSEPAVRQLADELSSTVAASLDRIIPTAALAVTIRHAVLDELAFDQQLQRDLGRRAGRRDADPDDITSYTLGQQVTELLDWFLRHHPGRMSGLFGEIVGEAQRRLGIPHKATRFSLWMALMDNSKLDPDTRREVLDRLLPPPDPDPDPRDRGSSGSGRTTAQGA